MNPAGQLPARGPAAVAAGRLRAQLLRLRGAQVAAKAWVAPNVRVSWAKGLVLGERVVIEEGVRVLLVNRGASLHLGAHAFVGPGGRFDLSTCLEVGEHTLFGPGCFVTDHNHGMAPDLRIDEQPCATRAVRISSDVWLGAHVIVLPGVQIGDGAVVAAGAVVTESVVPGTVVAGVPARQVGKRGSLHGATS